MKNNNNNDQFIYSAVNDIDRTKSETQGRRAAEGAQREATANKSAIRIAWIGLDRSDRKR